MKTSSWIAIGLFAATAAWLASGYIIDGDEDEEDRAATAQPTLVEVRPSEARTVPQYIFAQGGAQPFRTADVVEQASGTIDAVLVQEGDQVHADTVVARIRLDARSSRRESAQARVETLEADLEGMRQLARDGFAAESRVRELEAQLESARAELAGVREEIEDTEVKAPIPGIVSDVFLNAGQFAPAGGQIIRIVDNSPLRVTLHISQRDVGKIDRGSVALASFATGGLAKGRVHRSGGRSRDPNLPGGGPRAQRRPAYSLPGQRRTAVEDRRGQGAFHFAGNSRSRRRGRTRR